MKERDIQRIFKYECDKHNLDVDLFNNDVALYSLLITNSPQLMERIAELTIENYLIDKELKELKNG